MLLIVDDDPAFLLIAQEKLAGHTGIFFAGDAGQAKQLMAIVGATFSVVLIGLDLRGRDGFSLIAEMRRDYPDLPIIAFSSGSNSAVLESARDAGAVDVLRKPITPEWNTAIALARGKAASA